VNPTSDSHVNLMNTLEEGHEHTEAKVDPFHPVPTQVPALAMTRMALDEDAAVTRSQWTKPVAVTLSNKILDKQEEPITEQALEKADSDSEEEQVVASGSPEHQ